MAPKAAKSKAAAAKGAVAAAPKKPGAVVGDSGEVRWLRKQLAALAAQREAAAARGDSWAEGPHLWHEAQLEELLERAAAGRLAALPEELREGVQFYVSQLDGAEAVAQESFYDDRELYAALRAGGTEGQPEAPYLRPEESPDALEAMSWVSKWEATSLQVLDALERKLAEQATSPGVQEAGLKRISFAVLDGREKGSVPQGLAPKRMVPLVQRLMQRCPRDAAVLRQGCAALRALTLVEGGLSAVLHEGGAKIIVDALKATMYEPDAAEPIARTIGDLTTRTEANSPERAFISGTGVIEVLSKLALLHPNNLMIEKVAKTTVPFLRE